MQIVFGQFTNVFPKLRNVFGQFVKCIFSAHYQTFRLVVGGEWVGLSAWVKRSEQLKRATDKVKKSGSRGPWNFQWDYNALFFSDCALPRRGVNFAKRPIHSGLAGWVESRWQKWQFGGRESPPLCFSPLCPFPVCNIWLLRRRGGKEAKGGKGLPTDIRPLGHYHPPIQRAFSDSQNSIQGFSGGFLIVWSNQE